MIGTGTQTDPYIIDTWSDFVEAVGIPDANVEIAENTFWNMDDILPGGLTSPVNIKCKKIEGNFAEIRNLVKKSSSILTTSTASPDIYRLNLINTIETSSGVWFENTGSKGPMTFYNCTITGMLTRGKIGKNKYNSWHIRFKNDETNGCNINLQFSGNSDMGDCLFENSLITLSGNSSATSADFENFENCYIQGESPWNTVTIKSTATNIYDMKIGKLYGYNGLSNSSTAHKQNIVNKDKVTTLGDYAAKNLTLVTEAQLHDAEYLKSVGFPIL